MSEFYGLTEDEILSRIESGESISQISESVGHNRSRLHRWLDENPERSARAVLSRRISAAAYDDLAESCIQKASNAFQLAKAKDLAHHYRWRASKISPDYSEKIKTEHSGSIGVTVAASRTDEDL